MTSDGALTPRETGEVLASLRALNASVSSLGGGLEKVHGEISRHIDYDAERFKEVWLEVKDVKLKIAFWGGGLGLAAFIVTVVSKLVPGLLGGL